MSDHSFREELFPNIQIGSSLVQLEAITSSPIASYLAEETGTHLMISEPK